MANKAILFEEFLAKEKMAKRLNLNFKANGNNHPILVHGHCHQKAVGAMKSMRKALKLIPEIEFELIESSCCGMAGSFGLEAEHAELSNKMAELSLLPTVREKPDATVVANGFSCRHQIRDGSDHQPIHIAVLLNQLLDRQK